MQIRALEVKKINGYRLSSSGVYVPDKEMVRDILAQRKIAPDLNYPYKPQGKEVEELERARRLQQAVLLVGPTGVGKSMLVKFLAKKLDLPYLEVVCHKDMTDGKLRGTAELHFMPVEIDGRTETLQIKAFAPKDVALAGLADQPVVLFFDELHKMREGIETILHPLTNERYVNLSDIIGETPYLHRDSLVVLALNPYYEGGIERVPTALRARLKTLELRMITDEATLVDIVVANVPDAQKLRKTILKKLARVTAGIARAWEEITTNQTIYRSDRLVTAIGTELKKPDVAGNIAEAPSPRALVQAVRSIMDGEAEDAAIRNHLVKSVVRDFGVTANALFDLYNTL